jgi:ribosomal protein S18 acetylase RimI-like enzyme
MRDDEFTTFVVESKRRYAREMVESADLDPDAAQAKADRDYARLLPDGLGSAAQFLYVIEDEDGAGKGTLWFADREHNEQRCAFVYDLCVDEAFRGQHIGRLAMRLLEEEVRARGIDSIELNVLGGNTVARSLYRSLGYMETFIGMRKRLDAASASLP